MAVVRQLATNARSGKTEVERPHTLRAFCIRELKLISIAFKHWNATQETHDRTRLKCSYSATLETLSLSILTMSKLGVGRVLKATFADPWSASFIVETRTISDRLRAPNFRSSLLKTSLTNAFAVVRLS
ncbi:hypothetical protein M9H77_29492 [Catharanthus roseus]|uniref:Uncharacterized protein n=1 Tax=Catharanthus roseus TaxID=4058 RepID=A0ACB9ZVL7_CATRO|nr:hypothetical protein M9H77_29492 [Catharanthus roseus]